MFEKRGMGHLEAILAFVFFIGFLIFAFIFFSPFQSNRTLDSSLEYAFIEIGNYAKTEITIYSVVITPMILNLVAIDIQDVPLGANASVEDSEGNIIPSYTDNNGIVNFNRNGKSFVRIKYSAVFQAGDSNIMGTLIDNGTNYTISSSTSKNIFSEKKLLELNSSYSANYTQLKKQFNLPGRIDFGFSAVFSNGLVIRGEREVPAGLEVFGKRDRVEIIRSGGKIEFVDLAVNVW